MGGAGIQCGSAGIAFARASSARSRVFNAEVRFVWVQAARGLHGVTPETNRAALEAYNGRKLPLLALMNDTKPQGMLSGAPSKSPSGSPECVG